MDGFAMEEEIDLYGKSTSVRSSAAVRWLTRRVSEVLSIDKGASVEEVKKAYRKVRDPSPKHLYQGF